MFGSFRKDRVMFKIAHRPLRAAVALPIALILALGASSVSAQAAGEDLAAAAFERRDYPQAAALWEERANQGDMEAASQLGNLYRLGLGVPRDAEYAHNLLALAADAGVSEAQISIGLMLVKGEGVPANAAGGAKWIRRAADQGDAAGQYNLGLLYENGIGVSKDVGQARRWLQSAASQGHTRALERLETLSSVAGTPAPAESTDPSEDPTRPGPTAARAQAGEEGAPPSILRIRPDGQPAGPAQADAGAQSGASSGGGMAIRRVDAGAPEEEGRRRAELQAPAPQAAAPAPSATTAAATTAATTAATAQPLRVSVRAPEASTPAASVTAAAPRPAATPATPKPAAASGAVADQRKAALAAYDKGDFAGALTLWGPLAAEGDAEAAFRLGRMANRGEGGGQDAKAAWMLWRAAAAQGHRGAITALHNLAIRMDPAVMEQMEQAFAAQREGR